MSCLVHAAHHVQMLITAPLSLTDLSQDPDLFVFPPFPSPVFNFTILHHHAIPPDHSFPDGRDGYRLRGVLPTSLSRPPVGGPSLANLLQAVR